METVVQWATILSPIIAVIIAWWMTRSSAKDAAKQITSIKELAKIQIETTQIQISKELWDAKTRYQQTSNRVRNNHNENMIFNSIGGIHDSMRQKVEKERDMEDRQEFYSQQIERSNLYLSKIEDLKKRLEEK